MLGRLRGGIRTLWDFFPSRLSENLDEPQICYRQPVGTP